MRIRTIALSLTTGIGLVALAGMAALYNYQRNHLIRLDETKTLVQVIGHVSRFVEAMALERGVYNQLLVSPKVSAADAKALVDPRVGATDAIFHDTEAVLSKLPADVAQPIASFVQNAKVEVYDARSTFQDALSRGSPADKIAATNEVLAKFVDAAGIIDEALVKAERAVTDREPRLGLILKNPRLANEMREAAGQRSTILSRYAGTGIRLDDASRDKVSELTGAVHLAWDRLRKLSRQAGNTPKMEQAIAHVEKTFIGEGEPIYAEMARAARLGSPPPMEFMEWRSWTVKMLTTILEGRDAPIMQASEDLETLRESAEQNIRLTIFASICTLGVLAAFGFALERRVLKPINLLTEKLDVDRGKLGSADDSDVILKYTTRQDEIGALARALDGRRRYENEIAHLARHDVLTDLPNRGLFREELKRALAKCHGEGKRLAVFCVDLDRFKPVNDTLGHAAGDELLKQVGQRLSSCIGAADLVARLGGDEFGIIQRAIDGESDARVLAEKIVHELLRPFDIAGHQVLLGTSVGIAIGAGADSTLDGLVHQADLALYRAKAEGRQSFSFYHPDMDARAEARRKLELDLRDAVEQQHFELYFQPIIRLEDTVVTAFEALLRWRHPQRGMILPAEFIPVAEDTGLITQIGEWVLAEACKQAAAWPSNIGIAVNLSPVQFRQTAFPLQVLSSLSKSGLLPSRLELEITEAVLLSDSESTQGTLQALRELGVRIALDDFGTGYSSLSYLSRFRFDRIKIDRCFISGLGSRTDSLAIVRAVAALGLELGVAVTAEGVESDDQLASLRAVRCTEAQGFLFGRPMPISQLNEFLDQQHAVGIA